MAWFGRPVPRDARRPRHPALGRSCCARAARTSGWSCRRPRTGARARPSRCPRSCTRRSGRRSAKRGIDRLYSHQAQALHAAWAGPTIVTTGTASGKSLCFQLPTLDVLAARQGARAVPVPIEGARPGSSARAARVRRWTACAWRSTTATRRASSAPRCAGARTSCSRTPTCCTSGSCPTTAPGGASSRASRSSSSTRRTSTAACSAPTSPTCCAGCGGWPTPTAPSRASCSPARRSPTRRSSRSG